MRGCFAFRRNLALDGGVFMDANMENDKWNKAEK